MSLVQVRLFKKYGNDFGPQGFIEMHDTQLMQLRKNGHVLLAQKDILEQKVHIKYRSVYIKYLGEKEEFAGCYQE